MSKGKSRELVTYTRGYIEKLKADLSLYRSDTRYWQRQHRAQVERVAELEVKVDDQTKEIAMAQMRARSAEAQREEATESLERLGKHVAAASTLLGGAVGLDVTERRR